MKYLGTVSLEGAEFFAFHGLYDSERLNGNTFLVDIKVSKWYALTDLDSMGKTVDYERIYFIINDVMQMPEYLLETVAKKINEHLLLQFNDLQSIWVKVRKKHPPVKDSNINYSAFELFWEKPAP